MPPPIDTLLQTYFLQPGEGGQSAPQTGQDCRVTPIIDCAAYNAELQAALDTVGDGGSPEANAEHFVFIANWWLGLSGGTYAAATQNPSGYGPGVEESDPYVIDPWTAPGAVPHRDPPGGTTLLDVLRQKAQDGVDVRVLGWVSFAVMDSAIAQKSGAGHIAGVNALTMQSVKDLRAEPAIGNKAQLCDIAHTAGAVHNKFVVIGNDTTSVAFTGGLDFEMGRWARPGHEGREIWHDVMAKLEGPSVQSIFEHFRFLWHENRGRKARRYKFEGEKMPSHLPGTPTIPDRMLAFAPTLAKHHVQSLRTVPRFNYSWSNCLPENLPISQAPDGIFEYRRALEKALTAAETYIYIEDQAHWSQEVFSWVNDAVKAHSDLKVIILFSGQADPNDPASSDAPVLTQSINHGLLEGLTATQRGRVRVFRSLAGHWAMRGDTGNQLTVHVSSVVEQDDTSELTTDAVPTEDMPADQWAKDQVILVRATDENLGFVVIGHPATPAGEPMVVTVRHDGAEPPATGSYHLHGRGLVAHSKTMLVDDHWAVIGSGNNMRRSLYTDLEHGIAFIDEDGIAVREYRQDLWADHFRHGTPSDFSVISEGLAAWEPGWGSPGDAPPRPEHLVPVTLPFPEIAMTGDRRKRYDRYEDLDSREPWGGLCP